MMPRNVHLWGFGYLRSALRRLATRPGPHPRHLLFCIADHFEPFRGHHDAGQARETVREWCECYAGAFSEYLDADGRPPRHTFFYPADEYDPLCIDHLARFCSQGWGEVEVQLHHRGDTASSLSRTLREHRDRLSGNHGLLGRDRTGALRYGFVHGNWALCNARPDRDWCGVDEELTILGETGCYADFTFPSAPSPTQPRKVNAVYRAVDRPGRPRGHDHGNRVGVDEKTEGLLLVQGPLAPDWRRRKWGLLPRLENGELSAVHPPDPHRARRWAAQRIGVAGRPEWIFVKLHTHGCVPETRAMLMGPPMQALHRTLASEFNDGTRWRLHYVTARELYNQVRAAECGRKGNPNPWRDFEIAPPKNRL